MGLLNSILHGFGKEIVRWPAPRAASTRLKQLFDLHGIDLVLDVGANVGQYAGEMRGMGYTGRIVSFEPVGVCHEALTKTAASDAAWTIAPRMAVGDSDGEVEINVSNKTDMSSILPMRDETLTALPKSGYVGTEKVPLRRLDGVFDDFVGESERPYLKIDTQGFERAVLEGAAGIMDRIAGVQLEMSLIPLYEGETTWLGMIDMLAGHGFAPHLIIDGYFSKRLGRQIQVDAIFFRDS